MKPDKDQNKPKATPTPVKKTENKVFDVRRPGKALASPTSKPVIVGHKPSAQQAQTAVSGIGETRPLMTKRKIEILPTGDIEVKTVAVEAPKAPAKETAKEAAPAPEVPAQPTQEETEALATAALDAVTGPPDLPGAAPAQEKAPVSNVGRKIQPLTISDKEEESKAEPAPAAAVEQPASVTPEEKPAEPTPPQPEAEPEPAAPATEAESQPEPEAEPVSKPEPKLAEKELPAESSSMPEVEPAEKAEETEEKEEPAPEPKIEPLFDDSGAIVVSSHEHHRAHHGLKVAALLLLILLLAVAAFDIVLDLGLLNIEGLPHTDFL